jgi:hypothetical protein
MTSDNALRFLHHEARMCRDRDAHEALCLLLPALLKVMELPPMDDYEALAFRVDLHKALVETPAISHKV